MAPDYSRPLAARLAALAAGVYDDASLPAGYQVLRFVSRLGTQVYALVEDDGRTDSPLYIVFRGTEVTDLADLTADINAQRYKSPVGHLHSGFYHAFLAVGWEIERVYHEQSSRPRIFAGHSLGGALAVIAAAHLHEQVAGVYTYGAPRVGGESFAKLYPWHHVTWHCAALADPVPHVPHHLYELRRAHWLKLVLKALLARVPFGALIPLPDYIPVPVEHTAPVGTYYTSADGYREPVATALPLAMPHFSAHHIDRYRKTLEVRP